jgi:hypothetical protein
MFSSRRFNVAKCVMLTALVIFSGSSARAAEIHVSNLNDDGPGSLRYAIALANSGDNIVIDVTGTITLAGGGQLVVNESLTITGPGAGDLAISGNDAHRIFYIQPDALVTISGVTIRNGHASPISSYGGGIHNNRGTVTLIDSVVTNNISRSAHGGGIYNTRFGNVTLDNTIVSNNVGATTGGGIHNGGVLTLIESTVADNTAWGHGGGIYNSSYGEVTLIDSSVSGNTARDFFGGGIYNFLGLVEITDSIVSNNNSHSHGGGIYNSRGELSLTNSTVSSNTADTNSSGGIYNVDGNLVLTNSTIANNQATRGDGITNWGYDATLTVTNSTVAYQDGHGIFNAFGTTTLANSILAGNVNESLGLEQNCGNDHGGTIYSQGHNLSDDDSCNDFLTSASDLNNPVAGAGLDPAGLQNNGGPTQTIALVTGSIAIDAVPSSDCTVITDQRGFSRPQGDGCDIGAYELLVENTPLIIDIKPLKEPNSIYPGSPQKIPVAILTTADFDALQINPLTMRFGPDAAPEFHETGHVKDVDGDGDIDLLLHFDTRDTGIQCGDADATLTGETSGGQGVTGTDSINTVNCR